MPVPAPLCPLQHCPGVPSSCVSPERAEGHVQGLWAVRLRSLTAVAMTPAAPMRQENHKPAPRPAWPPGQLPQRGSCSSGRRSWPPRGPRPHTPGVPLGFPKCFRFGLQSPGHLQRAEEQLLQAPRSSLAQGTVCPRDTGTFAPGSVHSSVLGPSSPPSSCAPLAKACAACARPRACSPAELGEVSA